MNYDSDNSYSDCDSIDSDSIDTIDSSDTYSINTTDTIDPSELTPQVIDLNAYYYKIQKLHNFLQTCDEQYKPYNNGVLFEYICAIIVNARRFDDISTLVKEYYDMPFSDSDHYSAGVDLMDNVNNVLYQCKKYDNTPLLRRHLATFFHTLLRLKEFKGVVLVSEHTDYKYVREIKDVFSIKVITDEMYNNILERALSHICTIPVNIVTLSSELYDYQAAIIKLMEQNDKYSFQLPCGSGKSHLIMKYAITHNERIAILVPNISIAIMYCERMNIPVNKFFTGQECVEENNVSIVVYNSSTKLQRDYDTIIVDEAHHYLTDAHNIQLCKSKKLYLFSATLDKDECRKLTDNNYYILSQIDCINSHRILDFNIYIHCIGDDRQSALLKILKKYCEYQHVIVYCRRVEEAATISKMLNEHDIPTTYVSSSDLGQSDNQANIKAFSNGDYRVIVNCNIINEGIDIKGCETCIFYSRVESHVKIIQCIGRTQRINENKLHGNVVLLSNNPEEDLPIFLKNVNKQYTVNNKHYYSKYKVNVINDIDCTDDSVNIDDTIYGYERYIYENVYKTAYQLELCKEFYSEYQRLPTQKEVYKDFNIGNFISGLKQGHNQHLKQQVEEIFNQEINAVKKTVNLSNEDKLNFCKEFYDEFNRLPKAKEVYKDFNIGGFITNLKCGKNLQLKPQVEEIFNQEIKAVNKTVNLSDENKLALCKEFYNEFIRLPKAKEVYKDFNIGGFITNLKNRQNSLLKPQVEEIFNQEINTVKQISNEDKLNFCKEFYDEFNRLPKAKEVYKDFKIGKFIDCLKQGHNQHLKQQVEEIFNQEINAVKKTVKIVKLSDEDKINLCKEFYSEYQRLPTQKEVYKDFKIGKFITGLKQGYNQRLKEQVEEIFNQEIKAYNKKTV